MIIRSLALEDFTLVTAAPAPEQAAASTHPPEAEPAEEAMAAFDEGYRNGWEDCAKAEAEANRRIGTDLATNLQEMALVYDEARADVLAALGPLFEDMAAQLLPRLAAEAVAPTVIAELRAAAETASAPQAVLFAPPGAMAQLARLIEMQEGLDITLRAEPAFAEGQVSLRFGTLRRDIDLAEAARRMSEALRAFIAQEHDRAPTPFTQKGVA